MASATRKAKRSAALIFSFFLIFIVHGTLLLQFAFKVDIPAVHGLHGRIMLLAALEILVIGASAYLLLCNVARRLTPPQQHDGSLLVWCLAPVVNVAWHYTLPLVMEYDVTKRTWPTFVAIQMGAAVAFSRLPPAHLMFLGLTMLPPIL